MTAFALSTSAALVRARRTMRARDVLPRIIPYGWRTVANRDDGAHFLRTDGLSLIMSGCYELDGKRWLHLSIARPDRLPTWEELKDAKTLFLGRETMAIQVIPPESTYVNLHPFCLHLWHCLDGDPCPDFTAGGGTI